VGQILYGKHRFVQGSIDASQIGLKIKLDSASKKTLGNGAGVGRTRDSGYIKIDLRSNHQRFCWWSVSHCNVTSAASFVLA
jgi:hypothetical protein